jgi:hypothetical protein
MKPQLLVMFVALSLVAGAVGAAPSAARVSACDRTDAAVFYTTDTARLATELGKFAASCTDYYLSITPGANGPRGGGPITAIRTQGSRFHAMAEIRPVSWATYADANGGWYAAGVHVRQLMAAAGYDASLGDTWAVNEAGEPSGVAMNVDVIKGNGTARQDLQDFVRGLYTGDGTTEAGLVFAADPGQVTTDIGPYAQDLRSWYSDAPFWEDMSRYVRFWAQETYADARAVGVPGSGLAERSAYLNDYFLHASVAAEAGGAGTAAAQAFFANAYTPVANAAFRSPGPDPTTGIGFGYTDIGLPGMLAFVSTQTYALRLSTPARFGFAAVPITGTFTAAEILSIDDRIGASIQGSQSDASGACGGSCAFDVAGARFNGAWAELADSTPPTVVAHVAGPAGNAGWYVGDVAVTWDVSDSDSPVWSTGGCDAATITADTAGVTFTCTATSYGGTTKSSITVKRDATPPAASCLASPSTLWPPNGKLVPIAVTVDVTDATSGPGGFALTAVTASSGDPVSDIVGFDLGTPDVAGLLRAQRDGTDVQRTYALTYTAYDIAGNGTPCTATVSVPHDEGA